MAKVSVLIISYNASKFIIEALKSVISQSYTDMEIILFDDNSTDDTYEKAMFFLKSTQFNYVLRKNTTNIGTYQNMKRAFSHCNGDYIAYLEGDDFWIDEQKIDTQVQFLEANLEYSGVVTQSYKQSIDNKRELYRINTKNIFYTEDILGYTPFHSSTLLFRKNLVFLDNSFKNCISNDKTLYFLLTSQKPLFYLHNDYVTSVYRMHNGNITYTFSIFMNHTLQAWWLIVVWRKMKFKLTRLIYKILFKNHIYAPLVQALKKLSH